MPSPTPKLKIGVLYGGKSGEHEISLESAASVIHYLDRSLYEIIPIAIDKTGDWYLNEVSELTNQKILPVKTSGAKAIQPGDLISGKYSVIDVVFPVLHGTYGEDGSLQGMLDFFQIPYVGADVAGSAIGMAKDIAKNLAEQVGILISPFVSFNQGQWINNRNFYEKKISDLDYPVFVKPINAGSSVGITKVKKFSDLEHAVMEAFNYDIGVIVEKALDAREIEVSVLENLEYGKPPLCSVIGEIIPRHEFYSYEAKYIDKEGAVLKIPAELTPDQRFEASSLVKTLFIALHCSGMGRVDLFLEKSTGKFYFNEINTIPGFTSISMYPKLWEASGLSYPHLLTYLIQLAMRRHVRKLGLKLDFPLAKLC